jgi:hypothetical protein
METKMIAFRPEYGKRRARVNITQLKDAAWSFAYTFLWNGEQLPAEEIERAKIHLLNYFKENGNKKKAFIEFCERIVLAGKYIAAQPQQIVPTPSVWFNKHYQHGFTATKNWHTEVVSKRKEIPRYLKHISVVARHYYLYTLTQSAATYTSCHRKLLALNAKNLLQQFNNAIVHLSYLK